MAREDIQVNIRLPADLKLRLDKAAAKHKRSLTSEVVSRLAASFQDVEQLMLNNRRQEAMLIDIEIDKTEWLLSRLQEVVGVQHPDFQEAREYLKRLERYRELIGGGIHWIEQARFPTKNEKPAEVHEFPSGNKSTV